jgi:serine/threonine protein kinase
MVVEGRPTKMDKESVVNYISQLCSALCYLHDNCVIHRDLKPENVLVAPGGVIKLIDLGWSVYNPRNELRKTFCGTPIYLSPELLTE